jgi:hypothetical protein
MEPRSREKLTIEKEKSQEPRQTKYKRCSRDAMGWEIATGKKNEGQTSFQVKAGNTLSFCASPAKCVVFFLLPLLPLFFSTLLLLSRLLRAIVLGAYCMSVPRLPFLLLILMGRLRFNRGVILDTSPFFLSSSL